MANYMAEVAKMFGVEFDQDFECNESSCTYRITKNGVRCNGVLGADSLTMLLNGTLTIKHKPWKPKNGDGYWTVMNDGSIYYALCRDDIIDFHCYKLGNCYRTNKEAEANCDKWVAFYASDEVLEV